MRENRVKLYIYLVRKKAIVETIYPDWVELWFNDESKIVELFNKMTSKKYFTQSVEKFFELYACDLFPNSKYCKGVTTSNSNTQNTTTNTPSPNPQNTTTTQTVDDSQVNATFACVNGAQILKGITKSLADSNNLTYKLSTGGELQFNTDKSFIYVSRNDPNRKVKGTWECNGDKDFIVNTENNARLDSKLGYWEYDVIHKSTASETKTSNNQTTNSSGRVKMGDKGDEVKEVQNLLIKNGYKNVSKDGTADGIFGSRTLTSVKDFQSANKDKMGNPLKVDGIVGSATMEALKRKNLHENIIKKVLKRNLEMKNK
jgi:lysozyme family protein